MTPEQLKDIRDQLDAVSPWGNIQWRLRPDPVHGAVWGLIRGQPAHPYPDSAPDPERAMKFVEDAASHVTGLLSHVDALQARLDAAEAERDQLRAIFACDLLEDSEALRLAYERGKADATAKHIFTDASNSRMFLFRSVPAQSMMTKTLTSLTRGYGMTPRPERLRQRRCLPVSMWVRPMFSMTAPAT